MLFQSSLRRTKTCLNCSRLMWLLPSWQMSTDREQKAAYHFWSLVYNLQFSQDLLGIVVDNTIFAVKREGLRSLLLPTLVQGIQDANAYTKYHLEDLCSCTLVKADQVKKILQVHVLSALKSHVLVTHFSIPLRYTLNSSPLMH